MNHTLQGSAAGRSLDPAEMDIWIIGPVWIHGLELVLASLAPTNPETSKQGGLDWVRCN
jgi:hypothetical protein